MGHQFAEHIEPTMKVRQLPSFMKYFKSRKHPRPYGALLWSLNMNIFHQQNVKEQQNISISG